MNTVGDTFRRAVDALLLRDDAYEAMRDSPSPFWRGLVFVLVVGFVVALVGLVGAALTSYTSPDMGAIQEAVRQGILDMPWVDQIPPDARPDVLRQFEESYALGWQIARIFIPSLTNALVNVVLNPLALVVGWLLYGIFAFIVARILGGRGTLGETYGATALAAAPRMLAVVNVLPYVQTAGLGIWALICNYLALKNAHNLTPWRSFWATVLPILLLLLFVIGLSILGGVIAGFVIGGGA
jgi:hypothetical protein